jgi:hypothetical protein
MDIELINLLRAYVDQQIGIDEIRHWIARNVWDMAQADRYLVDQVAVELAYVDDGSSDEESFRLRISEMVAPTLVFTFPNQELSSNTTLSSNDVHKTFRISIEEPGKTDEIRLEAAFA